MSLGQTLGVTRRPSTKQMEQYMKKRPIKIKDLNIEAIILSTTKKPIVKSRRYFRKNNGFLTR